MTTRFATPAEMSDSVFVAGPDSRARLTRFWMLLVLSSIIAAAGVVADSTAAVIGAMIVAPLLGPIQGTMLATVLGDRRNLLRSLTLVVTGAAAAIVIGVLVGLTVTGDVVAATNSQVAGRVSPRLIDLLAALATGVVGSVALVRRDISDTLPGVAIAISLVPPLTVVGLTLESGSVGEALGALLLFVTNVVAIIATGIVVMVFYGVTKLVGTHARPAAAPSLKKPIVLLVSMLIIIGVPLSLSSARVASSSVRDAAIREEVAEWATETGWWLQSIDQVGDEAIVTLEGALPLPEVDAIGEGLAERGIDPSLVRVVLLPVYEVRLGE